MRRTPYQRFGVVPVICYSAGYTQCMYTDCVCRSAKGMECTSILWGFIQKWYNYAIGTRAYIVCESVRKGSHRGAHKSSKGVP